MSDAWKRTAAPRTPRGGGPAPNRHPEGRDRHFYRVTLAIEGRIRFLSHLETVDTLLGALRRSGVKLALSEGFRPKPRIKVAMPRPVAAEAWSDIVEVELQEQVEVDEFALGLSEALPAGLTLQRCERLDGAYSSAASRVTGATWRWTFGDDVSVPELRDAVEQLRDADEVAVERSSPDKPSRRVDVRRFLGEMTVVGSEGGPPALRAFVRLTETGSAKPEEVVRALGEVTGRTFVPHRTVRESIAIAEPGMGGRVAEPALVGADVPDGPAKPWGAC